MSKKKKTINFVCGNEDNPFEVDVPIDNDELLDNLTKICQTNDLPKKSGVIDDKNLNTISITSERKKIPIKSEYIRNEERKKRLLNNVRKLIELHPINDSWGDIKEDLRNKGKRK